MKEIIVDLEFTEEPKVAEIVGLETEKEIYKPGEEICFRVKLQPFRGAVFVQEGVLPLPKELEAVGGRQEERRSITSVEELVKAISESRSNGHITLEAAAKSVSLQLEVRA